MKLAVSYLTRVKLLVSYRIVITSHRPTVIASCLLHTTFKQ